MSEHFYLLTIGLLATPLLIFGMKYASAVYQARSRVAGEDAYRELAQKSVAVQSDSATSLSAMRSELSQVAARLAAVEKILKAVE